MNPLSEFEEQSVELVSETQPAVSSTSSSGLLADNSFTNKRSEYSDNTLYELANTSYIEDSDRFRFEGARLSLPEGKSCIVKRVITRGNDGVVVQVSESVDSDDSRILKISTPCKVDTGAVEKTDSHSNNSPDSITCFLNEVSALQCLYAHQGDEQGFSFPEFYAAHVVSPAGKTDVKIGVIEMSVVEGAPFKDYLTELEYGYSTLDRHRRIARNLANGIFAMAKSDVFHGELHEGNVLIAGSSVGLIDFGRVSRPGIAALQNAPRYVSGHSFALGIEESKQKTQQAFHALLTIDPAKIDFPGIEAWSEFFPENIEKKYTLFH